MLPSLEKRLGHDVQQNSRPPGPLPCVCALLRYLAVWGYSTSTSFSGCDDSGNGSEHVGMVGAICFLKKG